MTLAPFNAEPLNLVRKKLNILNYGIPFRKWKPKTWKLREIF